MNNARILAAFAAWAFVAHAGSSATYTSNPESINGGGGAASSASYASRHTVGQGVITGSAASATFTVRIGFWYAGPGGVLVPAGGVTLTITPPGIDFGGQSMGTTAPAQALTVTNTGGGTLNVGGVSIDNAQFAQTNDCANVAPAATCTIHVTFTPAPAAGPLNSTAAIAGTLSVASNAAGPGTATLAGTAEKSLVTHYYRSILRRAPDGGGHAYWSSEAGRVVALGLNVNEAWFAMAQQFYFSPEYAAFNRNNAGFVTDLYNTFFNRAPDSGGLNYWVGQLDSGLPREVALAAYMFSAEFVNFTQAIFGNATVRAEVNTVVDFYRGILARLPDDGGFGFWLGRFRAAQCQGAAAVTSEVEAISKAYTDSGEYAMRGRDNSQFVGDLYNAFLRRGGDLGGVQFWIDQVASGAQTRDQVRVQFKNSPEFQARVAALLAEGCVTP